MTTPASAAAAAVVDEEVTTTTNLNEIEHHNNYNDKDEDVVIIDNPCWGSPTACDLTDLLRIILPHNNNNNISDTARGGDTTTLSANHHQIWLYESPDYIVLNKPPDLRMDGDYPATVTKLSLYFYPPPSLSSSLDPLSSSPNHHNNATTNHANDGISADDATTDQLQQQQQQLLQRISTVARLCDVPDNELRPCHQLDYATSGVLLIARSKRTAARARKEFEDRHVHKMYTAVVQGHILLPTPHHNNEGEGERYFTPTSIDQSGGDPTHEVHHWSYVTPRALQDTMEQLEYQYRKSRHRHDKVTFQGYLPARHVFQRWQDREKQTHQQLNRSPTGQGEERKRKKKHVSNHKKHPIEWDMIFEEVDRLCHDVKMSLLNMKWEDVKRSDRELDSSIVTLFERAAQTCNQVARQQQQEQNVTAPTSANRNRSSEALPTLPTFFRVKQEEVKVYHRDGTITTTTDDTDSSFYIFAPLAQDTNHFSMLLHPHQHSLCPYLPVGDPTMHDFKPSLTKCTIVHRTYYYPDDAITGVTDSGRKAHPVTIVQMEPRTGRRHQLRIHAALLGHPIAGDATYCHDPSNNDNNNNSNSSKERTMVDRLCLHSTQLHLPNLLGNGQDLSITCDSPFRYHESNNNEKGTSQVTIDTI